MRVGTNIVTRGMLLFGWRNTCRRRLLATSTCDCYAPSGTIEGSMEPHESLVIVCTGKQSWPSHIEDEPGSIAKMIHDQCNLLGLSKKKKLKKEAKADPEAKDVNTDAKQDKNSAQSKHQMKLVAKYRDFVQPKVLEWKTSVRITACTEPSTGPPGSVDLMIYRARDGSSDIHGVRYTVPAAEHEIRQLLESVIIRREELRIGENLIKLAASSREVPIQVSPIDTHLILVCQHEARDKKCGRVGPRVIETMESYIDNLKQQASNSLKDMNVAIRGCSHIGGHIHAGVCIVLPQGDWYGRLDETTCTDIIDKCILDNKVIMEKWRGNQLGKQIHEWDEHGLAVLRNPPLSK